MYLRVRGVLEQALRERYAGAERSHRTGGDRSSPGRVMLVWRVNPGADLVHSDVKITTNCTAFGVDDKLRT